MVRNQPEAKIKSHINERERIGEIVEYPQREVSSHKKSLALLQLFLKPVVEGQNFGFKFFT